ncbi:MAG: hypothetical protein AB7V32_10060, partial [Candidatus Berkiella sp.]
GTNFSDLKSVAINLETWGPGTASFETEKEKIFKTLKESIAAHYGENCSNLTLEVCGHSQGAALSQLFVSEFLKRRAYDHEFDFVKALRMNVFNSPGVPHSTAQEATDATNVQWYVKRPIDIEANYCMVGGDAVQTTGNNSIFANLPPFLAKVNLLKIDIGMEGAWLKEIKCSDGLQPIEIWDALSNAFVATLGAHSSIKFYDPSKKDIHIGFKSEYYTNQKEEDRPIIAKELLNKALLLQYMLFFLKPIGHHVLDNKETYQELCCNRSYINSIYQKISGWFKRHADEIAKKDAQATQSLTLNH